MKKNYRYIECIEVEGMYELGLVPGMVDTHEYWSQHDAHLVYLPIFHRNIQHLLKTCPFYTL